MTRASTPKQVYSDQVSAESYLVNFARESRQATIHGARPSGRPPFARAPDTRSHGIAQACLSGFASSRPWCVAVRHPASPENGAWNAFHGIPYARHFLPTHKLPAVDGEVGAGDPTRFVVGEKSNRIGDFIGLAEATDWDLGGDLVAHVLGYRHH